MPIELLDDGLLIPEVGVWSREKYHILRRYLDAFTTAMKDKRWSALYYIDLFGGAGFAKLRGTNEIVAGSPIIAANVRFPFSQIRVIERDPQKAKALTQRLSRGSFPAKPLVLTGDANERIAELLSGIKPNSLSMAFVDPYGLHVSFATIQQLASNRSDLIVLLPDHMDILRNWQEYYEDNPDSNLDRFLGDGSDWRTAFAAATDDARGEVLRELYQSQLRKIGYTHFDAKRVARPDGRRLYLLVFASRSDVGLKLWRKVGLVDSGGQREFGFGEA